MLLLNISTILALELSSRTVYISILAALFSLLEDRLNPLDSLQIPASALILMYRLKLGLYLVY